MKSEALDITLTSRKRTVWLKLAGPFHSEQVPSMKEKITELIKDGNRHLIVDMEAVTHIDEPVVHLFLNLLNVLKEKEGDMALIFKNTAVSKVFSNYRNLFTIYPNSDAILRGGLPGVMNSLLKTLLRKTGVRISMPVAIFLLFILCGWFLSLIFIIHLQNKRIREQQTLIQELTSWKEGASEEIRFLTERLRPMEQLGILRDTLFVPNE